MLAELRIKNFVLIDQLSVTFKPGLIVLSGETGAGKSIIIDALNILMGGRSSIDMLREGADEAVVEGLFVIEREPWVLPVLLQLGLDAADELWIRRVLARNGRSRIYLNGGPIVLSSLKQLARVLVDFSSQNEHQVLLNSDSHLRILDAYAELESTLKTMRTAAGSLKEAVDELKALSQLEQQRSEREEFIRFQLADIERIAPQAGEDVSLEDERRLLSHSEKLHDLARGVEAALYSNRDAVVEVVGEAVRRLQEIVRIDPSLEPQRQSLQGALYMVEDVARAVGTYGRQIRFNPNRLEEIGARLAELSQLKRKHRTDLAGVLERLHHMKAELKTMESAEERREELERQIEKRWQSAILIADELSEMRQRAALALQQATETALRSLSMPNARFVIEIESDREVSAVAPEKRTISALGYDGVEFFFSANPGEPPRSLAKVASGGELSRVLLAVKHALSGAGEIGTFIFDEVDAGIGGAVAEVVGRKLREISRRSQLLCITHLAQIAAYADQHFTVHKEITEHRTRSILRQLAPDAQVEEISRMMGGVEITERTREYARELIERCRAYQPSSTEALWQS